MGKFEITAPDGQRYEIEGDTQEGALAALQSHLGTSTPAAEAPTLAADPVTPEATQAPAPAETPTQEPASTAPTQSLGRGVTIPDALQQPTSHGGPRAIDAFAEQGYTQAIANMEGDGVILLNPESGEYALVSPGRNISDSATVEEMYTDGDLSALAREDARVTLGMNPGANTAGVLTNTAAGLPFVGSYVDEALGAVQGDDKRDALREARETYATAHPVASTAANVGGAVLGSIPAAVAAGPAIASNAARTVGGKALQGVALGSAVGGAEGAIYGYGEGEGEERARNAQIGGALGATIGGVMGAAAPYAGAGVKKLVQRLRGSDVGQIMRELGTSRDAATVIRNAIDSGDEDAAAAAIARGGDNAMLADASGQTRSLVDTAAQMPGPAGDTARRAVGERTRAATSQMTDALDAALGPAEGEKSLVRGIMQDSAPARKEAYDAAYATAIDYSTDQGRNIERVLARVDPDVLSGAVREANMQMRDLGITNQQIRATIGDSGEVVFDNMPDVRQLDALKQALDSVAENSKNALGIMSPEGRRYANQARALRDAIGEAAPAYNDAVSLGGQAISERNAVDTGRKMLLPSTTRENVTDSLQDATEAELAAARQGVRSYIDDVTANVARTVGDPDTTTREGIRVLRDLSSRANQTKLRVVLGGEAADTLLNQIDEAATGFELRAAIAENSKTAARQATQGAVSDQTAPGILRTMAHGDAVDSVRLVTQALTGETDESRAIREMGLYQEIADALVNTRGMQANRANRLINNAIAGQALTDAQAGFVARIVTGALESSVPVANREASTALQGR